MAQPDVFGKGLIEQYPDFSFPDDVYERVKSIDSELGDLKGKLDNANCSKEIVERMRALTLTQNELLRQQWHHTCW